MLIDEITLHLKAGRGGNGVVRWLHEKGKEFGGPSGGDGGRGGNILVKGIRDIGALLRYRHVHQLKSESGLPGANKSMHGRDGADLILEFPLGSVLTNLRTGEKLELLEESEEVMLLKGGAGGRGNEHFKGSVNRNPTEWTPGKEGEEAEFHIELQIIADAGLIGLPNAGKSSLLNALTNASAKVGAYAFTTLEPNLGDCYGKIIADIPGLIEGASAGRGLGDKFLRHIRRTKTLLHCVALDNDKYAESYDAIRSELATYDPELVRKSEWIILTKSDAVEPETVESVSEYFKKRKHRVFVVSILDENQVKDLRDAIVREL
jgi:GTP-binding protein